VALVIRARRENRKIRVHGSRHSEAVIIGTDAYQAGRASEALDIRLDRMTSIAIDRENKQVTVDAGCRFGGDPREDDIDTGFDRSLNHALDAAGFALPNLGGVSHQTVAGFLMTGSAGGSLRFSLEILAIRFVDGTGEVHEWTREDPRFGAIGVSFGLLGIVTRVRLACVDRYDLVGAEQVFAEPPFDRDADGERGLEGFLRENEYARLLWWPQPNVDKWVLWTATRVPAGAAPRKAYEAFPPVLGSGLIPQAAAGWAIGTIGRRPWWLGTSLRTFLFNAFVPVDKAPRTFRDVWWRALPMDDAMEETFLPTRFTEIWLPLEKTGEVLRRLRAHYLAHGGAASGVFALEIYGAPANDLWGSPGYGRDSLRLNYFWFDKTPGNPAQTYFPQFWDLFADLSPRFHWAKLMPEPSTPAAVAMRASLPRLPDLLAERALRDPSDLFLSDAWRARLGLGGPPSSSAPEPFVKPRALSPLWFPLEEVGMELADRAPRELSAEVEIERSAEDVYDLIEGHQHNHEFIFGFRSATLRDQSLPPDRRRFREVLAFMTLDLKMIVAERGRRWAAVAQACSIPLATEMIEVFDFEALGPSRSRVRWRILLTPAASIAWAEPLVRPLFAMWLRTDMRRLKRFMESRRG